jgi:hypothetical protein
MSTEGLNRRGLKGALAWAAEAARASWLCLRRDPWNFFSGEWILDGNNGGLRVAVRALWVTCGLYSTALLIKDVTDPKSVWFDLDWRAFGKLVNDTVAWLGAIAGATYIAFYSRFASQWMYLSGIYNQIKQTEATAENINPDALRSWKVDYIAECHRLHLAQKPPFNERIRAWQAELDEAAKASRRQEDEPLSRNTGTYATPGGSENARAR